MFCYEENMVVNQTLIQSITVISYFDLPAPFFEWIYFDVTYFVVSLLTCKCVILHSFRDEAAHITDSSRLNGKAVR